VESATAKAALERGKAAAEAEVASVKAELDEARGAAATAKVGRCRLSL
jgi:hypothetical protein